MRHRVVRAFLEKLADFTYVKKLAVGILQEILDICQPLRDKSEHASLLLEEVAFVLEKIQKTQDEGEVKRRMQNLRDQVALRAEFMKDDVDALADKQAIYRLDTFIYKTSSKS